MEIDGWTTETVNKKIDTIFWQHVSIIALTIVLAFVLNKYAWPKNDIYRVVTTCMQVVCAFSSLTIQAIRSRRVVNKWEKMQKEEVKRLYGGKK